MWVDTASGKAFVVDDIDERALDTLGDDRFEAFFETLEPLKALLDRLGADVYGQLLFQREAQTFSPRLKGEKAKNRAYVNRPFVPFHIFDSPQAFHFAAALQFGWEAVRRKPYSISFLREVHGVLLPGHMLAGKFRETQVWLGRYVDAPIEHAEILLAPPQYIAPKLKALAAYAGSARESHRLATCAMLHSQIISIHPFFDGNGRVIRLLTPLFLRHFRLIDSPILLVSELLLERAWEYHIRLKHVERYGEVRAWVGFFVDMLVEQLRRNLLIVKTAERVRQDLLDRVRRVAKCDPVAFVDDVLLSTTFRRSRAADLLRIPESDAGAVLEGLRGCYGLRQIVDSADPVYQFGDVYDVFGV